MLPLIYSTPMFTVAFVCVSVITRLPETILVIWQRARRDATVRVVDNGSFAVLSALSGGGVILAIIFAGLWTGAAIPWFRPQVTIAGIVVMLLGAALRYWAIFTLGRNFSVVVMVRATQPVVRSGPYRYIRHPAYTGILLLLLGVGLALTNWASIVALLAGGLMGLLYRTNVEERALVAALGQPYLDYMRHTKRFIPYIF